MQLQSSSTLPDRHSFSGQVCHMVSSTTQSISTQTVSVVLKAMIFLGLYNMAKLAGSLHPGLPQPELHWTASDGYSTSNSVSHQTVMMEDDQQSNTPLHQQHQPTPQRTHGMSHSNSAPDLRLMLATQLPDSKPLFLPALGSYAGVMVPYKGPEVRSCSIAHDALYHTAGFNLHAMLSDHAGRHAILMLEATLHFYHYTNRGKASLNQCCQALRALLEHQQRQSKPEPMLSSSESIA